MSAASGLGIATEPAASAVVPPPAGRWLGGAKAPSWARRLPAGLAAGAAAALPVLGLLFALASAGWAPTADEAVIAWRSWDVLAGPSPLLGQFTQASAVSAVPVFDPGPLLYWVLAVPVHLLPSAGAAVGALGWSAFCVILACVAAGRAGGTRVAWCVAAGILLLEWSLSAVAGESPAWNPYAGLLPFASLLVISSVVAMGRVGWLPVALGVGSFVVQTHLMFAPAAVGTLVLAATVGIVRDQHTPGRQKPVRKSATARWAVPTALVAAACWWPTAYQEATGHPGNVTELLHAILGAAGPTMGWRRALGGLGDTLGPVPGWLRPPVGLTVPTTGPSIGSTVMAVLVLLGTATVGVLAVRGRRSGLGTSAGVAVVAALGSCWALAGISSQTAGAYAYIRYVTWPVALLMESVLAWGLVLLVHVWLSRRTAGRRPHLARQREDRLWGTAAGAVTATIAVVLSAGAVVQGPHQAALENNQPRGAAIRLAETVSRRLGPPQRKGERVSVGVTEPGGLTAIGLMNATGYRLRTMGWTPALPSPWSQVLDPRYVARRGDPVLGVGPMPPHARLLGTVDVPLRGSGTAITDTRPTPMWLLPARYH